MRLLICGDSFSCPGPDTWSDRLSNELDVINLSQAGASEYRIWRQWQSSSKIKWDLALICHTSANRLYCEPNIFHDPSGKHKNSDILYTDIKTRTDDARAAHVIWYFENIWDPDQALFNHELTLAHWLRQEPFRKILHITFFDYDFEGVLCLHKLWRKHPGTCNHLNAEGNKLVARALLDAINTSQGAPVWQIPVLTP